MARETKVGLLAGLAFIICFAVILTNKGQRVPFQPSPQVVDATRRAQPATPATTAAPSYLPPGSHASRQDRTARPTGWQRQRNDVGIENGDAVLGQPVHVATRQPQQVGGPVPARQHQPAQTPTRQSSRPQGQVPGERYRATETGIGGTVTPAPTSLASRQTVLKTPPAQRGASPTDVPNHLPQSAAPSPKRVAPETQPERSPITPGRKPADMITPKSGQMTRYTVAPGDTLSRIAANHYGRATGANVDGIVRANRDTIKNPDVLHVGAKILIPMLNSSSTQTSTAPSVRRAPTKPGAYTWYQIRPNDRYISIAREQLGDGSRWEEIHALNRDKFPDPGKIRVGVRIKLPVDRSASTGGRH